MQIKKKKKKSTHKFANKLENQLRTLPKKKKKRRLWGYPTLLEIYYTL